MESNEINPVIHQLWADKYARIGLLSVVSISLVFSMLRFVSGVVVFASYIGGFFLFHTLLKYQKEIEQWLTNFITGGSKKRSVTRKTKTQLKCNICGDGSCDRERTVNTTKPWTGLKIPKEIDSAIEELIDKILDEFVQSWYKDISTDASFQNDLRNCIRHTASVLLNRLLEIDIGKLVSDKLVPAAARHLESQIRTIKGEQFCPHPTIFNRETEQKYLRCVTTQLLPFLLQHSYLHCKIYSVLIREIVAGWLLLPLADVLADPAIINSLLVLLLSRQSFTQYPVNDNIEQVEFLEHFANGKNKLQHPSALQPDMCIILKEQSLLYAFMQFLKTQGAVHILQFCLDFEAFNKKMLNPEMDTEELDRLHKDGWDLYSVYFSPHSPDAIHFPDECITGMRKVLSKDVTKLRTSPPLFQAYEFAYNLLDSTYCPEFHSSDDFYVWLCGPRISNSGNKSESSSPSLPGSPARGSSQRNMKNARKHSINKLRSGRGQDGASAVFRLGSRLNKIKGALKANPVLEGQAFTLDTGLELEADPEYAEALQFCEPERDLSAWRVSVPNVSQKFDPSTNKCGPVYTINVQRIDVREGDSNQWTVERKQADFYTLESKLAEFHGEFSDAQLPTRRLLGPAAPGSRSESTQVYEEYLHKLLAKPSLRGSDLLYSFLSYPGEFVPEISALGRLLRRSVPIPLTLRKERGQNLDPFINTFFTSTETRSKSNKIEWKDMSEELSPRKQRNITGSIFMNNLGLGEEMLSFRQPAPKGTALPLNCPSDCLVYLAVTAFSLPRQMLQLILALKSVFGKILDALIASYVNHKIRILLIPQRSAYLIRLLKSAVFESRPQLDRLHLAVTVEKMIGDCGRLSNPIYFAVYSALQNPIQNKQLFYTLMDVCVQELFPEMRQESPQISDGNKQV
ncbi:hypothetical protein LSTR_LSTR001872 [Laodelphax striatellus]|uniref:PXA domain-containing protein n=1 Tax=Laodelphax striatellus TaxID=195883 RepID=A0A482WG16_LAOST|nr:hypothetical protein LSTR_LSTR001872 [Laodelphax striatellus]